MRTYNGKEEKKREDLYKLYTLMMASIRKLGSNYDFFLKLLQ